MATITLRRDDTCRDCGAELPAGSRARYYGRGQSYGLSCHEATPEQREQRRAAGRARRLARGGFLSPEEAGADGPKWQRELVRHPSVSDGRADLEPRR